MQLRNKPIVLTSDGHNSRINLEAIQYLKQFNIRLLILPSHMSHIIQAFDVCLSGSLKNKKEKNILLMNLDKYLNDNTITNDRFNDFSRYVIVHSLIQSWIRCSTPSACQKAFESIGFKPLNRSKVLNSCFVPTENYHNFPKNNNIYSISSKILTDEANIKEISERFNNNIIPNLTLSDIRNKLYLSEYHKGIMLSNVPSLLHEYARFQYYELMINK